MLVFWLAEWMAFFGSHDKKKEMCCHTHKTKIHVYIAHCSESVNLKCFTKTDSSALNQQTNPGADFFRLLRTFLKVRMLGYEGSRPVINTGLPFAPLTIPKLLRMFEEIGPNIWQVSFGKTLLHVPDHNCWSSGCAEKKKTVCEANIGN